uniref:Uncharacterized protein n=1 Tax=Ixodes scapularis TaxID=6945 RepID=A0A4D5RF09_IXOSC
MNRHSACTVCASSMSAAAAPGGRRLPAAATAAAVRGGEQRSDQHVEREPGPAEPPGGLVQLAVGLGRGPEPRGAVRPAHHGPGLLLRQAGIRDVSVRSQAQGAPADAVAGTKSRARLHRPALPGAGRPLRRLILPLQKNESGHLSGSMGPTAPAPLRSPPPRTPTSHASEAASPIDSKRTRQQQQKA